MRIVEWLAFHLIDIGPGRRAPDFVIGGKDGKTPYLRRWWLIPRNRYFNIYLHEFLRSDDARALHDHPWVNMSILLRGVYTECTIASGGIHRRIRRRPGLFRHGVKLRWPTAAHRVELDRMYIDKPGERPAWSIFITGPRVRVWGFHCRLGWKRWDEFVSIDGANTSDVGEGCGDLS